MKDDIYPVTIVLDRYAGTYSKANWTAWNKDISEVPDEIEADDVTCMEFWNTYDGVVGKGATPNEAYNDLISKL